MGVCHKKTPQYMSSFQPKWRRRREGKTDYKARRAMTVQDLKNYGKSKLRMVVRKTNNRIICQLVEARLQGDHILASADSQELRKYGLTVGLTNFSAAYATGLLLARRALTKFGLGDQFVGMEEADGEYFEPEETEDGKRPITAILDIGLARSTKGARVFAAMKGAVDGGMSIPHNPTCLPGEEDEAAEATLGRILGAHVTNYMNELKGDDEDRYQAQFSQYIKAGIDADSLEEMYRKLHNDIRADPKPCPQIIAARIEGCKKARRPKVAKLNAQQRRDRVQQKLALFAQSV